MPQIVKTGGSEGKPPRRRTGPTGGAKAAATGSAFGGEADHSGFFKKRDDRISPIFGKDIPKFGKDTSKMVKPGDRADV
jgi:hypothetical protein